MVLFKERLVYFMKRILSMILMLSMVFTIAGCTSNSTKASSDNSSDKITIVDNNGDKVTVPKDVKRIVVADILPLPSVLCVFFGSAKKIVGISPASMSAAKNGLLGQLYPEILSADTSFINGSEVNNEELLKLKPDVVFYNASSKELGTQLKNSGFNAVAVSVSKWNYNDIETLNNWIDLLSQIFPGNDKTKTVKDYSAKIYDMVQKRVADIPADKRARVFFLFQYSDTKITTSGKLFFGQWWADAVGAVNVAEELKTDNSVNVNMEQIYKWNPDIILMTNFTSSQPKDLYKNSVGTNNWSKISAAENKKVYKMPLGIYRSYTPGADTPMTLLWLAKTVYPDLFSDIDLNQQVKDYYKTVFGVELTDEQVASIFAPTSNSAAGI